MKRVEQNGYISGDNGITKETEEILKLGRITEGKIEPKYKSMKDLSSNHGHIWAKKMN